MALETDETLSVTPRMRSVERIAKLPGVKKTVDLANDIYVKVKDSNGLVKSVLNSAETTVKGAVVMTSPVATKFEGPIQKVDSWLCTSLDYVETKMPAVKLQLDEFPRLLTKPLAGEGTTGCITGNQGWSVGKTGTFQPCQQFSFTMVKSTRDSLYTIPGVRFVCQAGEHSVKKAVKMAYGAGQYGTQKLKDVKDILTIPPQNAEDSKNSFAAQYSLTAKRLLSLLISWLWITKPHIPQRRPLSSVGENALNDKKESEAHSKGISSAAINCGLFLGKESLEEYQGKDHQKQRPSRIRVVLFSR